ncbi:MAG: DUF3147 family protein [Sphaerochaeta sp.]|jgi:hypothetical protein|uniref:DUF3147 family protein n=1 Tax=Sphaerochaeta sp. TaxID=1972642 RepID=UPI003D1060B8
MWYYIIKIGISALTITLVSEIAKRSSLFGAFLASLPLTSLLAILWMHFEKTQDTAIAQLSQSIFFLVLPSLAFFALFPFLLHRGMAFWGSFMLASGATIVLYFLLIAILRHYNITAL